MTREMALTAKQELTTETLLWRGVIARTIQDWLSESLRPKREAERYLFENSADLLLVCSSAGIDVGHLRTCLIKVRGRTLRDLLAGTYFNDVSKEGPFGASPQRMPVSEVVSNARKLKRA